MTDPLERDRPWDVVVIGGGIVGLATAAALLERHDLDLVVLEKEARLAAHQTGHNSGVIHSGIYYEPGSAKARTCVTGRELLYRFCAEHHVPHERCGKVVVATTAEQVPLLERLAARGRANGIEGIRHLGPDDLREIEPHARGAAALHVPVTGIVDYSLVADALRAVILRRGGGVATGAQFVSLQRQDGAMVLETTIGAVRCRNLITCAGLESDRVARACGVEPGVRIVPFLGEYSELRRDRRHLVRNLIYPVPDPRFPFLGVHFTRRIDGRVEIGPNALFTLAREGYSRTSLSLRDAAEALTYPGFWRLAGRYWKTGFGELWRSLSRRALVHAVQELVPEVTVEDLEHGGAGVRAQAMGPDGSLLDDFHIVEGPGMLHVVNAPSPAATASLAIGAELARRAAASFSLTGGAAKERP